MKTHKLAYFILTAGIFILSFSTLAGSSIVQKYNEINGLYGTGKVSVNLTDSASQKNSGLTLDEIEHLQQFSYNNTDMAYAHEAIAVAAYWNSQAKANLLGISGQYGRFHKVSLLSGSFITPGSKDEMAAVVDEALAYELFGSKNVVGMYIELYGRKFRIIGVAETEKSIIQTMTSNGYGCIWIPVEQMLKLDEKFRITFLEIRADHKGTTDRNIESVEEALEAIGKNPSGYKIRDHNIELILLKEKAQIITFICGAAIIVTLLHCIRRRIAFAYSMAASSLKENYLKDALKLQCRRLATEAMAVIALAALICLVWDTVSFNAYVPAEFITDELIDLDFFANLIESLMAERVLSIGYIPSYPELQAKALQGMQSWSMLIGLLMGFLLYYFGLKLLEPGKGDTIRPLLYCCIFLVSSLAISLLVFDISGMPVTVDTQKILILFAFLFLTVSGLGKENQKEWCKNENM